MTSFSLLLATTLECLMTEAVNIEVILKEAVWIKQPYLGQKGRPWVILRSQFCLKCVRMYIIGWLRDTE